MMLVNCSHILLRALLCISSLRTTLQNLLNLAQGRMSGIEQDGYMSYVGIPYASVSGNTGKFKGPGLAPVWTGIRKSHDPYCTPTSAVEDCLQLDVHVPVSGSEMPIMIWIKGGSGRYHPRKLVAQGIVLVVVRHRLGPVGFLCSEESKIPGNAALKDVLQALRWVRDNIVAFNGNAHKVVVAGQSFGAAMVEALMLSPSARDLYHGVILQSGSILCPWTFNYDAEDRANALGQLINGREETTTQIIKVDTVTLEAMAKEIDFPYIPFGMCQEKPYKNEELMIFESPFNLLSKDKIISVPMLMGYNTNEAYVFASMIKEAKMRLRMASDMTIFLPEEFQNLSESELTQITKQIKDMYFSNNTNMPAVLSYHRDAYFTSHIHHSLRFHTTSQTVYYYQFSYSGDVGVKSDPRVRKTGAAHSDELAYLFPQNGEDLEDDDGIVQQHLIRLWTNFVKHLNPTPEINSNIKWEPTNGQRPQILDINMELEMKEFPHTPAAQMWNDIYEKYYYRRKQNKAAK